MGDYVPQNPVELQYYTSLFRIANPEGSAELGGQAAVMFFNQSGVDIGFLKKIWAMSTQSATMNIQQFFTALRFIAMTQNGEFPISKERLVATANVNLGYPKFNGIDLPAAPAPVVAPAPVAGGAPSAAAIAAGAAYAITPPDHVKYHGLFGTYDTNHDGRIEREAALEVFRKSGLDQNTIVSIFGMADDDKDGVLTPKEFCVAFHLIICLSKKGLPLPPSLPVPLKAFLVNAPAVPGAAPAASVSPAAVPPAAGGFAPLPPAAGAFNATAPMPAQSPPAKVSISSAFDFPSPAPAPLEDSKFSSPGFAPSVPAPTVGGFTAPSHTIDSDLVGSIDAVKGAAKKALAAQEQTLEHNDQTAASLQGIKQRLVMDRVSLEAAVNNASANLQESAGKLDSVVGEINELHVQMRALREQLEAAQKNQVGVQEQLNRAQAEKRSLQEALEQTKAQIAGNNAGIVTAATELGALNGSIQQQRVANDTQAQQRQAQAEELKNLTAELQVLRGVLASVKEDKARSEHQLTSLQAKLRANATALQQEKETNATRQAALAQLTAQINALKQEKVQLTAAVAQAVASASASAAAADAAQKDAASARTEAATYKTAAEVASYKASMKSLEKDEDADADAFAAAAGGFGDSFSSAPAASGFETLGATGIPTAAEALSYKASLKSLEQDEDADADAFASAATGTSGFDDFGSVPTASGFETFGATGSPTAAEAAAYKASLKSLEQDEDADADAFASAAGGFGDFGSTPAASGFDDFGSSAVFGATGSPTAAEAAAYKASLKSLEQDEDADADAFAAVATSSSGFDDFGAAPFANVPEPDEFGSTAAELAGFASGFDDFSAVPAASASGFEDFGAAPATGFDGFPALTPAAEAAAYKASLKSLEQDEDAAADAFAASAGFDAFGSAPASNGFETFGATGLPTAAEALSYKASLKSLEQDEDADADAFATAAGGFEDFGSTPAADGFETFGATGIPTAAEANSYKASLKSLEQDEDADADAFASAAGGFGDFGATPAASGFDDFGSSAVFGATGSPTAAEAAAYKASLKSLEQDEDADADAFASAAGGFGDFGATPAASGFDDFGSSAVFGATGSPTAAEAAAYKASLKSLEQDEDADADAFATAAGGFEDFGSTPAVDGFETFGATGIPTAAEAISYKASLKSLEQDEDADADAFASAAGGFGDFGATPAASGFDDFGSSAVFGATGSPTAAEAAAYKASLKSLEQDEDADADAFASGKGFGDFGATPTTTGFEAFGATPAAAFDSLGTTSTVAAGFDSFGSVPKVAGFDAFGAAPAGDGFDAFGVVPAAGGFDAFGAAPAAFDDGFATSPSKGGFDAF